MGCCLRRGIASSHCRSRHCSPRGRCTSGRCGLCGQYQNRRRRNRCSYVLDSNWRPVCRPNGTGSNKPTWLPHRQRNRTVGQFPSRSLLDSGDACGHDVPGTNGRRVSDNRISPQGPDLASGKATPQRRPDHIAITDLSEYVVGDVLRGATDHERDAVLGAVTAYAMHSRLPGWRDLYDVETNPITPLNPPPGYWMPI
jgi:hypothetical protein